MTAPTDSLDRMVTQDAARMASPNVPAPSLWLALLSVAGIGIEVAVVAVGWLG